MHIRVVWRTERGEYSFTSCRIGLCPAIVMVVTKAEPWNFLVAARSKNREAINSIEAPPTEPQRLKNELAVERSDRQLRRKFCNGVLIQKCERVRFLDVHQVFEFFDSRNHSMIDVVVNAKTIRHIKRNVEQRVLGQIANWKNEK